MTLSMQKTLNFGFKLSLTPEIEHQLSQSLSMSNQDLASYLNPKEQDYVLIPVRALSATSVQNDMLNFGHLGGKPLMDAVALFNGMTVLKDHVFSVDNWVGHTQDSYWDSLTPDVPPGVNTLMKIDTKADPKLARGLIAGDLNSVSVTVAFDYVKSHPSMSEMDFYMNLGTVVDDKLVQALVTKVTRLYEISVVWQGADKFAKQIGADGRIEVPGTSNSLEEKLMDWKKLALALGLTSLANPDETNVTAAVITMTNELATNKASVITLTTEKTQLTIDKTKLTEDLRVQTELVATKVTEIATLTQKNTELTASAKLGEEFLTAQRTEALRLYNLVEGDKATDAMRTMLTTTNLGIANSFITSYKVRAEALAPLACAKCGGTEVSRRTSAAAEIPDITASQSSLETKRLEKTLEKMHGKKA